jgi:hypothetical protein
MYTNKHELVWMTNSNDESDDELNPNGKTKMDRSLYALSCSTFSQLQSREANNPGERTDEYLTLNPDNSSNLSK